MDSTRNWLAGLIDAGAPSYARDIAMWLRAAPDIDGLTEQSCRVVLGQLVAWLRGENVGGVVPGEPRARRLARSCLVESLKREGRFDGPDRARRGEVADLLAVFFESAPALPLRRHRH